MLIAQKSYGQEKSKSISTYKEDLSHSLSIGYFGEQLFHYGFSVHYNMPLVRRTKNKEKPHLLNSSKTKIKDKTQELAWNQMFFTFVHRNNQWYKGLNSYLEYSTSKNNGFTRALGIGIGVGRSTLLNPTYRIQDGTLKRISGAGQIHFIIPLIIENGYNFQPIFNIPIQLYMRANIFHLLPYNSGILPMLAFELGTKFKLN